MALPSALRVFTSSPLPPPHLSRLLFSSHLHLCKIPPPSFPFNNNRFSPFPIQDERPTFIPAAVPDSSNQTSADSVAADDNFNDSGAILSACLVGVFTGIAVVLFNNGVHEIRDFFWDGIPSRGASWLREKPLESVWVRVISVPACGGLIVSVLNSARNAVSEASFSARGALGSVLKVLAACFTLGTGNSLGPEGPSVEIGSTIAKEMHSSLDKNPQTKLSLLAAGSAAGFSSGFNAAVAGCFFAVESVLWPSSPADSSVSLTNTTSMLILSAVIASLISEVGLGSEPAFKVPEYDFRSYGELPLYLLLGILCGLVSLAFSNLTSYFLGVVDNLNKDVGIPKPVFPVVGGLTVGVIALAYPEILYWGFENVDILLESRPFVKGLPGDLLFQLVAVKIIATSLCRAFGLVGGYYAPSLFIGAATGMAYGKFISFAIAQSDPAIHLSILEVASPQAYGLVGMAATLAGVCQVPLTAVLLLFELTQDYRIVLPLLGAVGLSSWVTSGWMKRKDIKGTKALEDGNVSTNQQPEASNNTTSVSSNEAPAYFNNLCEVESSLCVDDSSIKTNDLEKRIFVSEAMRTRFVTVTMSTLLTEVVTLMLSEKQSCAVIVDNDNLLMGLLTLSDIQEFSEFTKDKSIDSKVLLVSEICSLDNAKCKVTWTATPTMDILSAEMIMSKHGLNQVPVILEHVKGCRGQPIGLLDRECINLTCRAVATIESLDFDTVKLIEK
ncbi:Chloride channel protein CLC-e [Hibiscus syriacus]|uniref:Chloride channel protein n=1 Tax=Hibiscus syriacus TaxID=106335 RepID=A0A6A3B8Z2_HIBSY|nr:chloride channel protein CLC-e-like [Hibiscus syriacus]KAE8712833.1 Chloride channel protein CLC-e [Hibiscus syriacus]